MAYHIKLQNFEGPFDLLFHLIEKAEVDIYDIPIADITNQYLMYISEMESMDLEIASEFIVMAATLLQIKSKMLIPAEKEIMDEIAADAVDPRQELVERLIAYKKYKEVSEILKDKEEKYINIFFKNAEVFNDIEEDKILLNISLKDIENAFMDVIERYNESGSSDDVNIDPLIMREEITVDKSMKKIRDIINKKKKVIFYEVFKDAKNKMEIVTLFLALLELIKLKEIGISQDKAFADILLYDLGYEV